MRIVGVVFAVVPASRASCSSLPRRAASSISCRRWCLICCCRSSSCGHFLLRAPTRDGPPASWIRSKASGQYLGVAEEDRLECAQSAGQDAGAVRAIPALRDRARCARTLGASALPACSRRRRAGGAAATAWYVRHRRLEQRPGRASPTASAAICRRPSPRHRPRRVPAAAVEVAAAAPRAAAAAAAADRAGDVARALSFPYLLVGEGSSKTPRRIPLQFVVRRSSYFSKAPAA